MRISDWSSDVCSSDLKHGIQAIIHFAGSIIVPESVENPLKHYENNTVKSRSLIESAVKGGVRHFIFSSTAATYGIPEQVPVPVDARTQPLNPHCWSKLLSERLLDDPATAPPSPLRPRHCSYHTAT